MLTETKHGTRKAGPVNLDRGSCRLTITECVPVIGQPRRLNLRLVTEDMVVNIPVTQGELDDLADAVQQITEAPTIREDTWPLRLGDIVCDLYGQDVMVVGTERSTIPSHSGKGTTLVYWQDARKTGTWIALDGSAFTVRLPRPPVEEPHPEDVGA